MQMKLTHAFQLNEVAGEFMVVYTGARTASLSKVYSLNRSAAWLWNKIGDTDFTEELLVDWLCEEYVLAREVARQDVHNLVMLWQKSGMVLPE